MFFYIHPFFFNHTPTSEIYTLSLHDALPIYLYSRAKSLLLTAGFSQTSDPDLRKAIELLDEAVKRDPSFFDAYRSEEHTSELQSPMYLVCRLLLEKKKKETIYMLIQLKHTSN